MVTLAHISQPINGISIGLAVLPQYISVTKHTDRHTDHTTCDICRNRPLRCGL